jgi:hypothetical protein
MQRLALRALPRGLQQGGMTEELPALDQLVDPDDLLLDDAAGSHVEVADLGRALIARAQADLAAGGTEDAVGVGGEQLLQDGGMRERDGVAGVVTTDPPAVADDQHDRSGHQARLTCAPQACPR